MTRALPAIVALPLVVFAGIGEGIWTSRWVLLPGLGEAVSRLREVPMQVGDWQGEPLELDADTVRVAGLTGYVQRRYVQRSTGSALTVLLVCGRPGPIAAHAPEVCYQGAGYELTLASALQTVEAADLPGPAEFRVATSVKPDAAVPDRLRIFWSWTADGHWSVPKSPRLHYVREPALYKLYVVAQRAGDRTAVENDPALAFLRLFLPQVNRCLWPAG